MFEPFHPQLVNPHRGFQFHQYIRPDSDNTDFINWGREIFTGKLVHPFVDSSSTRLLYNGLLVKEIFANLLAGWAVKKISDCNIKPVLLIRNPFAVAHSKYIKKHWMWMTDPREFLKQSQLVEDYLSPFAEQIEKVSDDYIERQVMIWAIIHYVPLRQFNSNELYILFYENLVNDPLHEIRALFEYLDFPLADAELEHALKVMAKPSRVAGKDSSVVQGKSPIDNWKSEVSNRQIEKGLGILKTFDLDFIYRDSLIPQIEAKNIFRET